MPSTKVKDVLFRVSTQLQDTAPQFTTWTERELVDWLNDAQKAIAKYVPYSCIRSDVIKLKTGTKQSIESIAAVDIIPGDGSTAALVRGTFLEGIVRNMGADGLTPGVAVSLISRDMLDACNPSWHSAATKSRVDEYTFDVKTPKIFYVSPPIGTIPTWVEVNYLADPTVIAYAGTTLYGMDGSSTVTITVDDKYVDDLVNYVLARAQMIDSDIASPISGTSYMTMFLNSINAQVRALTGQSPNLQNLPFAPNNPATAS